MPFQFPSWPPRLTPLRSRRLQPLDQVPLKACSLPLSSTPPPLFLLLRKAANRISNILNLILPPFKPTQPTQTQGNNVVRGVLMVRTASRAFFNFVLRRTILATDLFVAFVLSLYRKDAGIRRHIGDLQ